MSTIRITTRKSPLALVQTELVIKEFKKILPSLQFEIVPLSSQGDQDLTRPLHGFSQVGVFVKRLEDALLKDEADCAIHCLKDLPSPIDERFTLPCYLEREEVEDVILYRKDLSLEKIHQVATGSARRKIFLGEEYPDWRFEELRGNINTRINKLIHGEVEATILALAGINRLKVAQHLDEQQMTFLENLKKVNITPLPNLIPAPGQGCLVIECLKEREDLQPILSKLNHLETQEMVTLERKVMETVEGGCRSPLGCLAQVRDGQVIVKATLERNGKINSSERKAPLGEHHSLAELVVNDLLNNL